MVTLQQLRYFRELAASGHLTQTAQRLYITQTTLSNTIINLEKQLGVRLFDRVGRTLQLNEAGRLYLMYVNEALIALDNGQNALGEYKDEYQQSVSVAMPISSVWSNLIHGFHKAYHHYSLRQITCEQSQFRSLLIDQKIDYLIAGVDDVPMSGLEHYIIRVEELFVCVPLNHRLAGKSGVYLQEVKDEPFINLPSNNSFRVFCDELFKKAGIQYRAELECDYSLRGKLVAAGFGIAITTNSSRQQNTLGEDVVYIPLLDDFAKRPIAIIWNPRHYLSKAALDFRDYVMETEL